MLKKVIFLKNFFKYINNFYSNKILLNKNKFLLT